MLRLFHLIDLFGSYSVLAVFDSQIVNYCSGRLLRTFADVKYGNHHLTWVEIVYNIISFIIAIVTTVAFTIYAKRALDEIKKADAKVDSEETDLNNDFRIQMETLPLERPRHQGVRL